METFHELVIEEVCPYGNNTDEDLQVLLKQYRKVARIPDEELIIKGFKFCINAHNGVFRRNGIPYYTHPLKVALSLMKEFSVSDNAAIVAALLHDTVEDVDEINVQTIVEVFGEEIALIVDAVTKIKGERTRMMNKAATYSKLFSSLVKDVRVLLIKLADRLDNLRTLQHLSPEKQKATADETLSFYTPFAQRLGLSRIKKDLEDFSLFYADRASYEHLRPALLQKRNEFISLIQNFISKVQKELNEKGLYHVLTIEHKHVYEIYKMLETGRKLEDIDNFYSLVITLMSNDYVDCYKAYGVIANVFGPVSSMIDYIARPKINFYRALHSTHFGPERKLVEVVIRTEEMDKIAEGGIDAIVQIKDKHNFLKLEEEGVEEWENWIEDIISEDDADAIQKIWGTIRMNMYEEQINIHVLSGNSYRLPHGASIIDLAYAISNETGKHCISGKVNGEVKNLDYELKNDETVEIISSINSFPKADWQRFVVSQKAIVQLFYYFKAHPDEQEKIILEEENIPTNIKLIVSGDDRPGIRQEITEAVGIQLQRIFLHTLNSQFEYALTLKLSKPSDLNIIFTKLLSIKGVHGIERVDLED